MLGDSEEAQELYENDPLFELSFEDRWAKIGNRPPKEAACMSRRPSSAARTRRPAKRASWHVAWSDEPRPVSAGGITAQASTTSPDGEQPSLGKSYSRIAFVKLNSRTSLTSLGMTRPNSSPCHPLEPGDALRFHSPKHASDEVPTTALSTCPNNAKLVSQRLEAYHKAFNTASLSASNLQTSLRVASGTCKSPRNLAELWTTPDARLGPLLESESTPVGSTVPKRSASATRRPVFEDNAAESSGLDNTRPFTAPAALMKPRGSIRTSVCSKASALGVGLLEADAFQLHAPGANIDMVRRKSLQKVARFDPIVAHFLDCLGSAFGTLTIAFQYLDIHGHGKVSKSEFIQCLLHGNSKASKNPEPVEEHMLAIFHRLHSKGRGELSFKKIADALEGDDPIIQRLAEFLKQAVAGKQSVSFQDDGAAKTHIEQCLRAAGLTKAATLHEREFMSWLKQLRYPRWHVCDLFHRLSVDGSNELTLDDFTNVFGNGPVLPSWPTGPRQIQPVATENAGPRAKAHKMRSACASSVKLGSVRPKKVQKSLSGSQSQPSLQQISSTRYSDVCNDLSIQRPDFVAIVSDALKPSSQRRASRRNVTIAPLDQETNNQ